MGRGSGGLKPRPPVDQARAQLDRIRADTPVTRRDYLRILVTVSAGLVAGTAGVAVGLFRRHGSGTAAPAKVADRLEPGQAVAFRYPGEDDRALAIRLPDGRLVGWSAVCTHLACAVLWRAEGRPAGMPPATTASSTRPPARSSPAHPRPLPAVRLREEATGIWAVGTN